MNQYIKSSDTAKHRVARPAKNRFGVCEGKMQNVQMIFVNESGFYALVLGSKLPEESIWITIIWKYRWIY